MDQHNTVMNLTADGLRLYNKVQRGAATLNLIRIVVGDGELAGNETAYDLVALKRAVGAVTEIINNEEIGDGTTRLTIRILSSVIDYYLREIGIIALDPDEGEILYAYCNFGEYADYIRTFNGVVATTQEIDIYIQIGNAPNMIVNVTDALVVTPKDLREHTDNKDNPHGVTAGQLGLNKALLDTITEQRLSNYDKAYNASHNHDNMAILAAITQAVIAGWNAGFTHSTTKGNPHNTSKSDIGLGNVANESKATMFNSPIFTGIPQAPTAAEGTSTNQLATTAFVQAAIKELYDKIKLLGNSYLGDVIDSLSVEIYRIQHGGRSEYEYYKIRCTGCKLTTGDYISNNSDKYIQYGSRNYSAGDFVIGFDPNLVVVTPINDVTLDNCLYVGAEKSDYKIISISDIDHWSDERREDDGYVIYEHTEITIRNN